MAPGSENGPYNLLSIDGGGIRGVSELVILHRIMKRIQEKEGLDKLPKPCDYFHIIGGTSTGGLIAIMLGRLRMSTTDALAEYDTFARAIFRDRNRKFSISARYNEHALKDAICAVVAKHGADDSDLMRDPSGTPWCGKAFVCAKPALDQDRGARRFRSYPSDDDSDRDCRIWEVARATTAAPSYFRPISIRTGDVAEDYIDAAMGCNNPAFHMLDEAGEVLDASCKLGCFLSLGTGTKPKSLENPRGIGRTMKLIPLLKDYTTDSEDVHDQMKKRFTDFPSTYFRLSVPHLAAKVGMAHYKKIPELKQMTEEYIDSTARDDIEKVVDILCEGKTENLTVGHARYPNQKQIIMDTRRAHGGGVASRLFTGRTEILDKMSAFFPRREDNLGPRRDFLLYGMGGVGKTQIALKFKQMMESEKRFDRVLWIDATDSATIEESYTDIAPGLLNSTTGGNTMKPVLNWLDTTSEQWLLIMDNVMDSAIDNGISGDITRFLPTADRGNVVYTTRHDDLKLDLDPEVVIEVTKMGEQEAVSLLLKSTRQPTDSAQFRGVGLSIVEELGCLPLAIDQAGAYMYMEECSMAEYLRIFLDQRRAMLQNPRYKGSNAQNLPVYATFDLSYKVLKSYAKGRRGLATAEAATMAIKILSFICFYHNQNIMEDIVKSCAERRFKAVQLNKPLLPLGEGRRSLEDVVRVEENGNWNPESYRNAVRLLESLSILKRDRSRSISMHVLVHSWARDRMNDEERDSFSASARRLLYNAVTLGMEDNDHLSHRRLAPHVKACESLVRNRDSDDDENWNLAKRAAITKDAGRTEEAVELWESMIRERKLLKDPDSVSVLDCSNELASTYRQAGSLLKAEALLTEITERVKHKTFEMGDRYRILIIAHSNLANMYYNIGLAFEATKHYQILIKMLREEGGPQNMELLPDVQEALGLAQELAATGKLTSRAGAAEEKSESDLWEEYDEAHRVHGPDGDAALRVLSRIGSRMDQEKRSTCAYLISQTVISRCRERHGPSHIMLGRELHNYAKACLDNGMLRQARVHEREALEFCHSHNSPEDVKTKAVVWKLAYMDCFRDTLIKGIRDEQPSRTSLPLFLNGSVKRCRGIIFRSVCHELPCGQSAHYELIHRLGIGEYWPDGALVSIEQIGPEEMDVTIEDVLYEEIRENPMESLNEANRVYAAGL